MCGCFQFNMMCGLWHHIHPACMLHIIVVPGEVMLMMLLHLQRWVLSAAIVLAAALQALARQRPRRTLARPWV
jgi:hypothetical protein